MKNVKVSVIIPSLNVSEYIDECMESVLRQSLREIEVICVDAGSDDGTFEIIDAYQKTDQRVRLITSEKKSYGYQVNCGMETARGKYLAVIDSDDFIHRDMYSILWDYAIRYNIDYVKGNYYAIQTLSGGRRTIMPRLRWRKGDGRYGRIFFGNDKEELYIKDSNLWSGIFRVDFLRENNIKLNESKGAAYQDIGFVEQTIGLADKCIYIEQPLYYYRTDRPASSVRSGKGLKYVRDEYEVLLEEKQDKIGSMHGIYLHMTDCFVGNLVLVDNEGLFMSDGDIHSSYEWLREKICKALEKGIIRVDELSTSEGDLLREALYHPIKVIERERKKREFLSDTITMIKSKHREMVIFGCGSYGVKCLKVLDDANISVKAFVDNDPTKQGQFIAGIPVVGIEESMGIGAPYIVANKYHGDDIRDQLLQEGIDEDLIFTFS